MRSFWIWFIFLGLSWIFAFLPVIQHGNPDQLPWRLGSSAIFFTAFFLSPLYHAKPAMLFVTLLVASLFSFTIVALSMLLVGILQSPEQFGTLFPSIIPIMPLISGVYMPPGTITNPILLGIAEGGTLTIGMGLPVDQSPGEGPFSYDTAWRRISSASRISPLSS